MTTFSTTKAIGTGPFAVEECVPDQHIIYSPNPDYFRGATKLDSLICRSFNGYPTAMMVATEAGKCNWVIGEGGGRPVELQRLAGISELDLEIFNPPANVSVAYWWNLGREHIQNPLIRQGIQHAINGEQFNQVMASGVSRTSGRNGSGNTRNGHWDRIREPGSHIRTQKRRPSMYYAGSHRSFP